MDSERNPALDDVDNVVGDLPHFHAAREGLHAAEPLPVDLVEDAAGHAFGRPRGGPCSRCPHDKRLADVEHQAAAHEVVVVASPAGHSGDFEFMRMSGVASAPAASTNTFPRIVILRLARPIASSNAVAFGVEPFNLKVREKLRPELRQRRLQTPAGPVGLAIARTRSPRHSAQPG